MAREDHLQFPDDPSYGDIYNRAKGEPGWTAVHFREAAMAQAADINDLQQVIKTGVKRVGDMVADDGDRISGANIINQGGGSYRLLAGEVYVQGEVLPVAEKVLTGVAQVGRTDIGVRLVSTVLTHEQDPDLLGLHPGTEAEGEPGAVREVKTLEWCWLGGNCPGEFFRVYALQDGDVIDQTPPPALSDVNEQIANYDRRAHGNYIAEGCLVRVANPVNGAQVFSVGAGVANIQGRARYREADSTLRIVENPDLETVDLEAHEFVDAGGGSCVFQLRRTPVAAVSKVIVTKRITETVARGSVANTADTLGQSSVQNVVSVVQGGTTYVVGTDYVRVGDTISWAPGGAEPATSSSYDVTYDYLDEVPVAALTATTVTASGGLVGGLCFISYSYKLPRIDRICMNRDGALVYVPGISSRNPEPPPRQSDLLSLATVTNTWVGPAIVDNNGTRAMTFDGIRVLERRLLDTLDLIALDRLQMKIALREPTAKRRVFVDPFADDRWRDAGEVQTLAAFDGTLQLPVTPTFHLVSLSAPATLSYTEDLVLSQPDATECRRMAPYIHADIPPLQVEITPHQDYWTETEVVWTSTQTQEFGAGADTRQSATVTSTKSESAAQFLRPITINYTIRGLGDGEEVESVHFDGIDLTPGTTLVGDANGVATGSFVIPNNVPAGWKRVVVKSETDRIGSAVFDGRGTVVTYTQTLTTFFSNTPEPAAAAGNATVVEEVVDDTARWDSPSGDRGGDSGGGQSVDPTAQSFVLSESRHVTSLKIKCCAVGDRTFPVIVELVRMRDGQPVREVLARAFVSMATIQVGQWLTATLDTPVFLPKDVYFAWVIRTDDPTHALSVARLGGYDETNNRFVTKQPYTLGDMFDGSNSVSWLVHPDKDITMEMRAAKFAPLTRTVPLGTFAAIDVSDIMIRTNVTAPDASCRVAFSVRCGTEPAVLIEPNQNFQRRSYFTGNVTIDLVMYGTETTSPIVARDILIVFGKLESTGRYVTRAQLMGVSGEESRIRALFASSIPTGSSVAVGFDKVNDVFETMTLSRTEALVDGTIEREYQLTNWDGLNGRLQITLTGTPAARPAIYDLRAWSIEEIA